MIRRLPSWLGFAEPVTDAVMCVCGHDADTHQHWRSGSDCGDCGPDGCHQYTPDLAAVCRDSQVIDAVEAGDLDHALLLAEPEFVALLAALADTGRRP